MQLIKLKPFFLSFFLVLSIGLYAQTIGGTVSYSLCGEIVPAAGVKVLINFPGPYLGTVETEEDGTWDYSIFNSDPNGTYFITVAVSGSQPLYYSIKKGDPNNSSMDFLIDFSISEPLGLVDCGAGEYDIDLEDTGFNTVVHCNTTFPNIPQFYWDALGQFNIPTLSGGDQIDFPGCARYVLYSSTSQGQISGPIATSPWKGCVDQREACKINDLNWSVPAQNVTPGYYYIELEYGCCKEKNCRVIFPPTTIIDKTGAYVQLIEHPSETDVDFNFITSLEADAYYGTDVVNGIEASSVTAPGPALGPFSAGVDANVTNPNGISDVTYTIREVFCGSGLPNGPIVCETTVPVTGQQPEHFLFLEFKDDTQQFPNGEFYPYFAVESNFEDKCFHVTVTVSNDCGEISAGSFFTITEDCYTCFNDDDSPEERNNAQAFSNVSVIKINPNPATDFVEVRFVESIQKGRLSLFSSSGELLSVQKVNSTNSVVRFSIDDYPAGLYFIRLSGEREEVQQFIKL